MDQCGSTKNVQMGRKRGRGKVKLIAKLANGQAIRTRLNQLTKRCQPRLVAEGAKRVEGCFGFHNSIIPEL